MKNFQNKLNKTFALLWLICGPTIANNDTLDLGHFFFKKDTCTVFRDSSRENSFTLSDTVINMAITLKVYKGNFNFDSLVDAEFKISHDFEFNRDSLRFDSAGIEFYYKFARTIINDSLFYTVFSLAKQYKDVIVIFYNAVDETKQSADKYLGNIDNVIFKDYSPPEPTNIEKKTSKFFNKKLKRTLNGWLRFNKRDLRGRK